MRARSCRTRPRESGERTPASSHRHSGGKAVRPPKVNYDRVTVYHDDLGRRCSKSRATAARGAPSTGAFAIPENIATVERGVRSLDTIARLADAGVSRVVLGTSLVADPDFAEAAIAQYGKLLCAGIDAKGGEVAVAGWREGAGVAAEELARDMSALGFRHLVYTDIARDGMQTGIEAAAYVRMAEAFGHPVIASGGVAGVDDIVRLGEVAGSIEGVIAGRAVYEGALSVQEGVRACDEATRRAEAAAVQANPCGM